MKRIHERDYQELKELLDEVDSLVDQSKKRERVKELIAWMEQRGFHEFETSNKGTYPGTVGSYSEENLPQNKRGHLSVFAGKRVIVICVGSGSYRNRKYMAGLC